MITEKDLFAQGWKRFGDEKNDPYYKIFLYPLVFELYYLTGNFKKDGYFKIHKTNRMFTDMNQINELFTVNGFVIDSGKRSRYGSDIPLETQH